MQVAVQYLLFFAVVIAGVFGINYLGKKKNLKRKWRLLLVAAVLIAGNVVAAFPYVNAIHPETSPEAAFARTGKGEIVNIVQGERSCLVTYKTEDSSFSDMVLAERNGRYYERPAFFASLPHIGSNEQCNWVYSVVRAWFLSDIYVSGMCTIEYDSIIVTDTLGSEFSVYEEPNEPDYTTYLFAAYIPELPKDYTVSVNAG